jgi:hypothetical protein
MSAPRRLATTGQAALLLFCATVAAGALASCGGSSRGASLTHSSTSQSAPDASASTSAATTTTTDAPVAQLSATENRKLSSPGVAIIDLASNQSLAGVTELVPVYRSEVNPKRSATLRRIAALDPACVSYGPYGSPTGLALQDCPATSSDSRAQEEAIAGPAVTSVIHTLRSANVSTATREPNDSGFKLTVGGDLKALIKSLNTLQLSSEATRLLKYEESLPGATAAVASTTTTTSDVTRQPNTSSDAAQPSGGSETTAVEDCPSTYGVTGRHRIPSELPAEDGATNGLVFYANSSLAVLAPKGWSCSGAVGVDGSARITVGSRDGSQEITASDGGACVSCNATISTAASALPTGISCPSQAPAAEEISRINGTTDAFEDPPYVHGTGTPSGGGDPANGVMIYAGRSPEAYTETCTLPSSQHTLCTVILDNFLSRYP